MRHFHFQHHDGDHDGKHAITEGLESRFMHAGMKSRNSTGAIWEWEGRKIITRFIFRGVRVNCEQPFW